MFVDPLGLDDVYRSPGVFQVLFPATTAPISRYPIGGSVQSQIDYANVVNRTRASVTGFAVFTPYACATAPIAARGLSVLGTKPLGWKGLFIGSSIGGGISATANYAKSLYQTGKSPSLASTAYATGAGMIGGVFGTGLSAAVGTKSLYLVYNGAKVSIPLNMTNPYNDNQQECNCER